MQAVSEDNEPKEPGTNVIKKVRLLTGHEVIPVSQWCNRVSGWNCQPTLEESVEGKRRKCFMQVVVIISSKISILI